jgi:hypothetical protein
LESKRKKLTSEKILVVTGKKELAMKGVMEYEVQQKEPEP